MKVLMNKEVNEAATSLKERLVDGLETLCVDDKCFKYVIIDDEIINYVGNSDTIKFSTISYDYLNNVFEIKIIKSSGSISALKAKKILLIDSKDNTIIFEIEE